MSYAAAIIIVVLAALAATLASVLVDRVVSLEARRRHHEVGSQVFQLIGVMFAVMLAFVFNEVWAEYNTAKQAITAECGALHGAAMLVNAMPHGEGRPINEDILAYTREVIDVEWATMAKERRSLEAAHGLRAALDAAARLRVDDANDLANRSQIITLLAQAHAQRETRTFQLALQIPAAMWAVLVSIAFALVGFVVLSGTEKPATIILASTFTVSIVMVLVLVRMLEFPFQGALAIDDRDFVKLNSQVSALLQTRS